MGFGQTFVKLIQGSDADDLNQKIEQCLLGQDGEKAYIPVQVSLHSGELLTLALVYRTPETFSMEDLDSTSVTVISPEAFSAQPDLTSEKNVSVLLGAAEGRVLAVVLQGKFR